MPERYYEPELETRYRAYLTALNDRRLNDLAAYVADDLTYNGEPMTLDRYRDLIAADVDAAPDLFYDAQIVVATDDRIACRITFACTPVKPFLGFTPTGDRITFAEHVFYRFHEGRITEVWSLIDREAVRSQLTDNK